jgi:glyoxylase-like metal-dependent hydrolase (beta-lactamase superfamily II)
VPGPTPWICLTCGTSYPPSPEPPPRCPICLDERQYVGPDGQRWVSPAELAAGHANRVALHEPGLLAIATEPKFAIGQRALLVDGLLWDCLSLLDDATAEAVAAHGGIRAIAISHPHYYSAMADWAERFDAPILLHADDAEHIMRPSPRVQLWSGERHPLWDGLELVRLGGHFAGATVCLWPGGAEGRGALLSGDVVQVVADTDWASFMWSYPNFIPLPAREVQRMRGVLETLAFDRVYGAFWSSVMREDGRAKVLRSADRYLAALAR